MATIRDTAKARAMALPPVPKNRVAAKTIQGQGVVGKSNPAPKGRSLMDALTKVGAAPGPKSQSAQNLANRDTYEEIPEGKIRRP